MKRLLCFLGRHDWRVSEYPEPQYPGVSVFAGTWKCRRCLTVRYWTGSEQWAYMNQTPWRPW